MRIQETVYTSLISQKIIYIFRTGDTLNVYSGALEYVDDTYNILDIVAKNIDGGLDSIQKRWKRYEKVVNI